MRLTPPLYSTRVARHWVASEVRTRLCVGVVGMEDFYGPLFDIEVFGAEKAVMKVLIFQGNRFSDERARGER